MEKKHMSDHCVHVVILCKNRKILSKEKEIPFPGKEKNYVLLTAESKRKYFYIMFYIFLTKKHNFHHHKADFIARNITGFFENLEFDEKWAVAFYRENFDNQFTEIFMKEMFEENSMYDIREIPFFKILEKIKQSSYIKNLNIFIEKEDFIIICQNCKDKYEFIQKMAAKYGYDVCEIKHLPSDLLFMKTREDSKNYSTVIMNKNDRTKIRVFDKKYKKSFYPETVYLRVIENKDFLFNRNKKGNYASLETVEKYADIFENMEVFEVYLGGNNFFYHPNFMDIIEIFKERNIFCNVITSSSKFINEIPKKNRIRLYDKDFLIHVDVPTFDFMEEYDKIYSDYWNISTSYFLKKPVVRHFLGMSPINETLKIMNYCYEKEYFTVFLDKKDSDLFNDIEQIEDYENIEFVIMMKYPEIFSVNRKDDFVLRTSLFLRKDQDSEEKERINIIKNYIEMRKKEKLIVPSLEYGFHFSTNINSKFSKNLRKLMSNFSIPNYSYNAGWGKFSMYVDAIENRISSSPIREKGKTFNLVENEISMEVLKKYWDRM